MIQQIRKPHDCKVLGILKKKYIYIRTEMLTPWVMDKTAYKVVRRGEVRVGQKVFARRTSERCLKV